MKDKIIIGVVSAIGGILIGSIIEKVLFIKNNSLYLYKISEKIYLNLVKNSIDEVLAALKNENTVARVHTNRIPKKQLMVQKGLNNERVLSHSYVSDSYSLDVSDNLKFIVISDTHFGSKYENFDYLKEVYDNNLFLNTSSFFETFVKLYFIFMSYFF